MVAVGPRACSPPASRSKWTPAARSSNGCARASGRARRAASISARASCRSSRSGCAASICSAVRSGSAGGAASGGRRSGSARSEPRSASSSLARLQLVELGAGEVELGLLVARLLGLEIEVGDVADVVLALGQLDRSYGGRGNGLLLRQRCLRRLQRVVVGAHLAGEADDRGADAQARALELRLAEGAPLAQLEEVDEGLRDGELVGGESLAGEVELAVGDRVAHGTRSDQVGAGEAELFERGEEVAVVGERDLQRRVDAELAFEARRELRVVGRRDRLAGLPVEALAGALLDEAVDLADAGVARHRRAARGHQEREQQRCAAHEHAQGRAHHGCLLSRPVPPGWVACGGVGVGSRLVRRCVERIGSQGPGRRARRHRRRRRQRRLRLDGGKRGRRVRVVGRAMSHRRVVDLRCRLRCRSGSGGAGAMTGVGMVLGPSASLPSGAVRRRAVLRAAGAARRRVVRVCVVALSGAVSGSGVIGCRRVVSLRRAVRRRSCGAFVIRVLAARRVARSRRRAAAVTVPATARGLTARLRFAKGARALARHRILAPAAHAEHHRAGEDCQGQTALRHRLPPGRAASPPPSSCRTWGSR